MCSVVPNLHQNHTTLNAYSARQIGIGQSNPYDSACDFCLIHNGYGRVNALLYENALSRHAYV